MSSRNVLFYPPVVLMNWPRTPPKKEALNIYIYTYENDVLQQQFSFHFFTDFRRPSLEFYSLQRLKLIEIASDQLEKSVVLQIPCEDRCLNPHEKAGRGSQTSPNPRYLQDFGRLG